MQSVGRFSQLKTSITRWRSARGMILGSIILAGAMTTSATLVHRLAKDEGCRSDHVQLRTVEQGYTYSGIGAIIQYEGSNVVIRHVFPNSPAELGLAPGLQLISVDGTKPTTLEEWGMALRGPVGTSVRIEVEYPCGGQRIVVLERTRIHTLY